MPPKELNAFFMPKPVGIQIATLLYELPSVCNGLSLYLTPSPANFPFSSINRL